MLLVKIYVLETSWSWDHSHTEYATITAELMNEQDRGYDSLGDPNCSSVDRDFVATLLRIADGQRGNGLGEPQLVRLYRVCEEGIQHKYGEHGEATIIIKMEPICDFDRNNNPIPVRKT